MTEEAQFEMSAAEARIKNAQMKIEHQVARLEKLGVGIGNVDHTRNMFMVAWIFENVLTNAQREDFTLAWLKELEEQLNVLEGKAREAVTAATRKKLGVPAAGLTLPGNVRRTRS
jgi:hypothetical protein